MADEPEPLLASFAGLCGALRGLQAQVEALARVHAAVDAFNASFGAFQNAVGLHASCLQFPRARAKAPALGVAPGATGIPLPQATSAVSTLAAASSIPKPTVAVTPPTAPTAGRSSTGNKSADRSTIPRQRPPASSKKRSVKVAAGQKTQQRPAKKRNAGNPPPPPAWTWEKWVLEKVPKKYQSPQEIKKLENIILYIKNRGEGISIADLVKHSGLAVIKCKEILQTLMKLELIERKHEESGFVYTFGSSS